MLELKIPATSANIGSGFDSLGLALDLYNYVWMEEHDGLIIQSMDDIVIPTDESNLIYDTARRLYAECGRAFPGLRITQKNDIPLTRGLGSSSACIIAGLLGANTLMGGPIPQDEIIHYACVLEGHPDNVAPALLGGLVTSALEGKRVYYVKQEIHTGVKFAAFIPNFELSTKKARAALPEMVSHKDAVFNLSRAALASVSLYSGNLQNLRVAVDDRLHQPYRLGLIPGADKVFDLAYELGAYGVYVSGAGPTIMAIVDSADDLFEQRAAALLKERGLDSYRLRIHHVDNTGATVRHIGI